MVSEYLTNTTGAVLRDSDWVRRSFMLSASDIEHAQQRWRFATHASLKFTDTSLGGNWAINNPPQYTRFADIRNNGINAANSGRNDLSNVGIKGGRLGMGRYYSEAIDDQRQLIHCRFGVPEYNGMVSFFTGFFDNDASLLANEGRASIAYYLGVTAGLVVSISVFPYILVGEVARFFLGSPASKYYYLRPTPPLYLNRVNLILNTIAVNMGIVPRVMRAGAPPGTTGSAETVQKGTAVSNPQETEEDDSSDDNYRQYAHAMLPDIFDERGGINVYSIINRPQRMADAFYAELRKRMETASGSKGMLDTLKDYVSSVFVDGPDKTLVKIGVKDPGPKDNWEDYLKNYHNSALGDLSHTHKSATSARLSTDVSAINSETPVSNNPSSGSDNGDTSVATENSYQQALRDKWQADPKDSGNQQKALGYGHDSSFLDYWIANREDGQDFVTFGVEYNGTVSETFTNGTRESDIASRVNGMSSGAREARFSFSDGNTGSSLIDGAVGAVRDFASGVLDGVHMGGLLSLAGAAFVDIPKHWENSTITLPTASYSMELRTPYGNKFSRFMNLQIPIAFLLAAALPISTGKASYTAPFLVEMYHRGRNQIRLGLIESLSITRGAGNMGWNNRSEFLGVDVSFTIVDLTSIIHFPIDGGFNLLHPFKGIFDADNAGMDYLATLGNLSMADQIYKLRKLSLNLTRKREQFDTFWSRAHFASATDNFWPTRAFNNTVSAFMRAGESTLNIN